MTLDITGGCVRSLHGSSASHRIRGCVLSRHPIVATIAGISLASRGRSVLEKALGEAAVRYPVAHPRVCRHAQSFPPALELTEPNLSEGMRWLQRRGRGAITTIEKSLANHSRAVSKLSLSNMVIVWPKSATIFTSIPFAPG